MADTHSNAGAIWALGMTQIIGYGTLYYSFSILAPGIAIDLGVAVEWIYGCISLALLAGGLISPWAGGLADRLGAGRVMSAGSIGAAAALAGMLYSGMMQTARFNFGEGAELMAIAAVILGGTSLFGGRGTILGTFAGSLLIGTINNGLIIMGLDVSEQMMVSGGIIILAVAFGKKPTG